MPEICNECGECRALFECPPELRANTDNCRWFLRGYDVGKTVKTEEETDAIPGSSMPAVQGGE